MTVSPDLAALLERPVLEVAPALLGAVLRHTTPEGTVAVRLSEVEAYDGAEDPGSHAFRGMTRRNEVMFGPSGHLYTYFIYGMHVCANLVTGPAGAASAVLLRAGEIVEGVELARARRGPTIADRDLARGPGRLCAAVGLTLGDNGRLAEVELPRAPAADVRTGPRVGLRQAADLPWRFWLADDRTVSVYRAAKRR